MKTSLVPALSIFAALGLALPAVPAAAQSQSVQVDYADLNLATPEGQAQLDRRIDKAAREVCGTDRAVTGTRLKNPAAMKCLKSAKEQIGEQIAARIEEQKLGG
ncbi:UrcA family protein [Alteriqipengyuania lutimaris]|nr:UrcA family protein [Alteriqipengyuania lutimaris]MBB3034464.1 UrcA family protein [Alteriqipengyuania lutimaris]